MTEVEFRALGCLIRSDTSASIVGAYVWPNARTRGCAAHGGGHYAAQMLLGRMRKRGWVYVAATEGSSMWSISPHGIRAFNDERSKRVLREAAERAKR